MSTTKFTEDHEWVMVGDDGIATVGITDFAQEQLGDLVFVELPDVEREFAQGDEAAVLESVKAAGEVKAPIGGVITEINDALADDPALVNQDPEGDGWFFKLRITDAAELGELLDKDAYEAFKSEQD